MSKRNTFRPTVQSLETRKLMAGDVMGLTGVDDPTVDGDQTTAVIADAVRVDDPTEAEDATTDDVYVDGNIITAENYDSAATRQVPTIKMFQCPSDHVTDNDANDAVFTELGSDTGGDTAGATWTFTGLAAGDYNVSTS